MIDLKSIRSAVRECFASDPELIERYHIAAGSGLEGCVERTMQDVAKFDPSFKFFPVLEDGKLIAYWGTEFGNYINLIFVKPSHRDPRFMRGFWQKILASVADPYFTAVYAKNTPALLYYLKRGGDFDHFKIDGQDVVAFTFKKVGG